MTAFGGTFFSTEDGIFTVTPGGPIQTVATTRDATAPGHTRGFSFLGNPIADGQDLAFNSGIYSESWDTLFARIDGTLMQIADADAMLPFGLSGGLDVGGLLQATDPGIAIDNGRIVFQAQSLAGSTKGLFSWTEDEGITQILGPGDLIDGVTIADFEFSSNGFSDDTVVFVASYSDGVGGFDRGVFTATVPEPGSLALLGLGGLMIGMRRRRSA